MRPRRQKQPGAYYHVTATTNNGERTLDEPSVKTLFLQTIAKAKVKYQFALDNFCILGNHFHFLIRPGKGEDLSRIMQWILSRFARAVNLLTGKKGHFWGERFYSRLIRTIRDYWHVVRYVDENPRKAGLVAEGLLWPFSGVYHALHGLWVVLSPWHSALERYWTSRFQQTTDRQ
jgi:putative transposase